MNEIQSRVFAVFALPLPDLETAFAHLQPRAI